ncbi:MAG: C40 family peptidase [Candidatus Cohnella colombiensis]|uniref:C40 family peptidase n=1 Tax=Candidatus Cohnella colombiensis TaxID=3121368 RepID=A0AA95EYI2_9BACL|nr:MAG: C40 family peptidase [Cohnella sp.]
MIKSMTRKIVLTGMLAVVGFTGVAFGSGAQASAATAQSLELLSYGKEYIGTPYKYGSPSGVTSAFDCSSFVQYVFQSKDISLPRTSVSQAYVGDKIDKAYLSVGDLVFYRTGNSWISHVAIYAGDGKILHASSTNGVTLSDMNTSYWKKAFVMARRVL